MSSTPQDIGQSIGRREAKFHEDLDRCLMGLSAALLGLIFTVIFAISYCVKLVIGFNLQYGVVAFGVAIVLIMATTMALVARYAHKTIVTIVEYRKQ